MEDRDDTLPPPSQRDTIPDEAAAAAAKADGFDPVEPENRRTVLPPS